jgi:hypothetical protein
MIKIFRDGIERFLPTNWYLEEKSSNIEENNGNDRGERMNLDSSYDFDFEHLHYFFKYFQTVAIQTAII